MNEYSDEDRFNRLDNQFRYFLISEKSDWFHQQIQSKKQQQQCVMSWFHLISGDKFSAKFPFVTVRKSQSET